MQALRLVVHLLAVGLVGIPIIPASAQTQVYKLEGLGWNTGFGASVAGIGDVNGDGFDDVVGAAPDAFFSWAYSGYVRVYSGLDGSVIYTLTTPTAYERFGSSIADGGDLDGDGVSDLLVGATGPWGGGAGTIRAYSGAGGTLLYAVASPFPGTMMLGISVASVGDIDQDGVPDWIAGGRHVGVPYPGAVVVASGSTGTIIFTFSGSGGFGQAVGAAGDVNFDGVPDLLIGAPYAGPQLDGTVYVRSGATGNMLYSLAFGGGQQLGCALAPVGDIDQDGASDFAVGARWAMFSGAPAYAGAVYAISGASGSIIYVLPGTAFHGFLGTSLANAGNVDGYGVADLVVGESGFNSETGRCSVYSGDWGSLLFAAQGSAFLHHFGSAVSAADMNADGVNEIIIGAPGANGGTPDSGAVYTFSAINPYSIPPGCVPFQSTASLNLTGQLSPGGVATFSVLAAGPGLPGFLGIGPTLPVPTSPLGLGFGCPLHVNPLTALVVTGVTGSSSAFAVSIAIPPGLNGQFSAQAAVLGGPWFGYSLTNAVHMLVF